MIDYNVQVPELLILAQKRAGSHFLQNCIKCSQLTGVTFLDHIRAGGSIDPIPSDLFRIKNGGDMRVQFLRYHDFNTRQDEFIEWLAFSDHQVKRAKKIVVLRRESLFDHALADWFNDKHFDRNFKRKNSHEDWVEYRESIVKKVTVPFEEFDFYYRKAQVFYRLFRSLYERHEDKCCFIFFEGMVAAPLVLDVLEGFSGLQIRHSGELPEWQPVDYTQMEGYEGLKGRYP